jgi:hypothetical protein
MTKYQTFFLDLLCAIADPVGEEEYSQALRHLKEIRLEELSGDDTGVEYE